MFSLHYNTFSKSCMNSRDKRIIINQSITANFDAGHALSFGNRNKHNQKSVNFHFGKIRSKHLLNQKYKKGKYSKRSFGITQRNNNLAYIKLTTNG